MSHFTAVLEIIEVKEVKPANINVPAEKVKAEVARVVVRADSIEALRKKLSAHVALIED